ncbi:MAG: AsmA family protein [Rhodospirillales bacterium]|nr:AsmA family protein [Rhodospirillales bacterium]MBO6787105.1 AsmA family protein [Rhodospirillales bacterium]
MKKILWAIGGVIGLLLVALLVVPNVIDWNSYKGEISEQVRKLTGRELIIAGDIDLNVLPAPVLIAEKVSLGSIDGADSPDLVSLRSVEVRIALAPLLGGNISVETVRLVEPQVFLEVLADGRATWAFSPPKDGPEETGNAAVEGGTGGGSTGPAIALGSFEIVDGSVTYQDAGSKVREQIKDIDINLAAASLTSGPFRATGSLVAKGLRLGIDADIGEIVGGRTFPLDLSVMIGGESAKLGLAGTVLGLDQQPRFRGTLNLTSENVGKVVSALADGASLPAPLGQPLKLSGALDASAASLALDDLTLDFGGAKGKGKVSGTFSGVPKITASMSIDKVDADPWLAAQPAAAQSAGTSGGTAGASGSKAGAAGTPAAASEPFALPAGIAASLAFRIGEVSVQGGKFTNAVLNAELANGELNLTQLSLKGPGGSDLAAFGFLTARDGKPAFDGQLQGTIAEPHTLMKWAGADTASLKPGKPGAITLNVDAGATPDTITVRKLGVAFDKTNINGAATVVLRERIGVGASVVVDQLDLDAYLADTSAADKQTTKPAGEGQAPDGKSTEGTAPPAKTADGGILGGLKPLGAFDANLRANVGLLKTQGVPVRDVSADISLVQGDLTIRKFAIADVLSSGVSVTGSLLGLDSTPTAKGLSVRAEMRDPSKVAAFAGTELPIPAKSLGKVEIATNVNGDLLQPSLNSSLKAMAATLEADGNLKLLDPANMFDLGIRFRHGDTANLLRKLGMAYRPAGDIGGLDLSTKVRGGPDAFTFSQLAAAIGAVKLNGDGTVRLAGERPKVTATLATGNVVVDPFLPAKKSAALTPAPARVMPARFIVPESGRIDLKHLIATISDRWPTTPIDLSGLRAADADVTLTSPRISYHEYNLDGAKLLAGLENGVLRVNDFSGVVFGGTVNSTAKIDAGLQTPTLVGLVTLGNMDIGAASQAAGITGTTGKLTSRIDVGTAGGSVADWVRALRGKGAIEIKGIKGQNSLSDLPVIGLALGPLMQIFEVLNTGLGSIVGAGGKTKIGETDVTSNFTIDNGIINTPSTKIISNIYEGNVSGDINLPLWSMNIGGKLAVDQGILGAVLANVARLPSEIPFQVTGNIDKPNVKIQSFSGAASQGGSGIKIPGLDKLEKKAPGVGGLLQGILGGGSGSGSSGTTQSAPPSQTDSTTGGSAPPSQSPPSQSAPQQQQKINPTDILKKLLQ